MANVNGGGNYLDAMRGLSEFLTLVAFDLDLVIGPFYPSTTSPLNPYHKAHDTPTSVVEISLAAILSSTDATYSLVDIMPSNIINLCSLEYYISIVDCNLGTNATQIEMPIDRKDRLHSFRR